MGIPTMLGVRALALLALLGAVACSSPGGIAHTAPTQVGPLPVLTWSAVWAAAGSHSTPLAFQSVGQTATLQVIPDSGVAGSNTLYTLTVSGTCVSIPVATTSSSVTVTAIGPSSPQSGSNACGITVVGQYGAMSFMLVTVP